MTDLDLYTSNTPRLKIKADGKVGIGTTSPAVQFHIDSGASNSPGRFESDNAILQIQTGTDVADIEAWNGAGNADGAINSGGWTTTSYMRITANGDVGIGTTTPGAKFTVVEDSNPPVSLNRTTDDGKLISLSQDGSDEGTISVSGAVISCNAFTGSHYGWTDRTIELGTLVTLTGDNRRLHDNADSEIIYGVAPSAVANDPAILGAYLGLQESNELAGDDNPHLIMAVGNGVMWVVDDGMDVEIGDLVILSEIPGHATVDRGQHAIAHVVARTAEPVHWDEVYESVDGRKHRRISVLFEPFTMNRAAVSAAAPGNGVLDEVRDELTELRSQNEALARTNTGLGTRQRRAEDATGGADGGREAGGVDGGSGDRDRGGN